MRHSILLAAMTCAAFAGQVRADTPEVQKQHLDEYAPYLEAPVDEFKFWSLYKWQLVGPDKVVVWSTVSDAYLLTVEQPCTHLQWASGIGVTSQASHTVMRRLDAVTAGRDRCRIVQIQPIDTARMRADDAAK